MCACVALIEEGYHSTNPYHNAVHAADVAQAMHCYLQENKVQPLTACTTYILLAPGSLELSVTFLLQCPLWSSIID